MERYGDWNSTRSSASSRDGMQAFADLGQWERRSSPRIRMFKQGKLILPNNNSVFDCIIRDMSEGGARVSCSSTGVLPNEMQLVFCALREVRVVRVVWRRPDQLGLQFLTPPRPASHLVI